MIVNRPMGVCSTSAQEDEYIVDIHEARALCLQNMHKYVSIHLTDGQVYTGVIEHVDDYYVIVAVPTGERTSMMPMESRQFFGPGFGFPGMGFPGMGFPGFGFPGFGFGFPFMRFGIPLGGIAGLSMFPFFI